MPHPILTNLSLLPRPPSLRALIEDYPPRRLYRKLLFRNISSTSEIRLQYYAEDCQSNYTDNQLGISRRQDIITIWQEG
jgi:hypothetical protein